MRSILWVWVHHSATSPTATSGCCAEGSAPPTAGGSHASPATPSPRCGWSTAVTSTDSSSEQCLSPSSSAPGRASSPPRWTAASAGRAPTATCTKRCSTSSSVRTECGPWCARPSPTTRAADMRATAHGAGSRRTPWIFAARPGRRGACGPDSGWRRSRTAGCTGSQSRRCRRMRCSTTRRQRSTHCSARGTHRSPNSSQRPTPPLFTASPSSNSQVSSRRSCEDASR